MSKRDSHLLVEDMHDATSKILTYTSDLDYQAFVTNDLIMDAVVRNFEIIGEASNKVDHYFGVDYEIVWSIIQEDLEELSFQLNEILKQN